MAGAAAADSDASAASSCTAHTAQRHRASQHSAPSDLAACCSSRRSLRVADLLWLLAQQSIHGSASNTQHRRISSAPAWSCLRLASPRSALILCAPRLSAVSFERCCFLAGSCCPLFRVLQLRTPMPTRSASRQPSPRRGSGAQWRGGRDSGAHTTRRRGWSDRKRRMRPTVPARPPQRSAVVPTRIQQFTNRDEADGMDAPRRPRRDGRIGTSTAAPTRTARR